MPQDQRLVNLSRRISLGTLYRSSATRLVLRVQASDRTGTGSSKALGTACGTWLPHDWRGEAYRRRWVASSRPRGASAGAALRALAQVRTSYALGNAGGAGVGKHIGVVGLG